MENEQFHLGFIWSTHAQKEINRPNYESLLYFLGKSDTVTSSFQFPELRFDNYLELEKILPEISQPIYYGLTEKGYPLRFSNLFQKSFIEISHFHSNNDQSLELDSQKQINQLFIDRTFTFYLRETHSGLILLIGQFVI
jgi:hypothetical protein